MCNIYPATFGFAHLCKHKHTQETVPTHFLKLLGIRGTGSLNFQALSLRVQMPMLLRWFWAFNSEKPSQLWISALAGWLAGKASGFSEHVIMCSVGMRRVSSYVPVSNPSHAGSKNSPPIPESKELRAIKLQLQGEWWRKPKIRKLSWRSHMARPKCRNSKHSSWFPDIHSWAWSVSPCRPGWAHLSTWAWTRAKCSHHQARRLQMISARILLQALSTRWLRCPSTPTSEAWTLQDLTWCWKSPPSSHASKWPKSLNARCSQRLPRSRSRKSHENMHVVRKKTLPCGHGFKKTNRTHERGLQTSAIGLATFRIVKFKRVQSLQ